MATPKAKPTKKAAAKRKAPAAKAAARDHVRTTARPHRVRVFRSTKDNQWYVRRSASNGRKIATSEGYRKKARAVEAAEALAAPAELVVDED